MTATLLPLAKQQYFDASGNPLSGGKVYTYAAGTSTPQTTYQDAAATIPNANPVILDSRGEAQIFWTGSYKVTLKTSADVTIWTVDNVTATDMAAAIAAAIAANNVTLAAAGGSALVGFQQAGTGAIATTAQAKMRRIIDAADFGVVADGTTDDTTNLQRALDYIGGLGGGDLMLPIGTMIINQSVLVWSGTRVIGKGRKASIIKAKQGGGFVGTNAGLTCFLLRNKNYSVSALTDADIAIISTGFDYGTVTVAGGGAHCIAMRYVDGVTIRDCYGTKGENTTALLACRDTMTENCEAYNQSNAFFDHWDGAGTAKVIGCVGRNDGGTFVAQGIQFTGTGSAFEDRSTTDCWAAFNYLENVRGATSQSSAIIANANDAGSSTYRMRSICNVVKNSDMGIIWEGAGGQHMSLNDTLVGVDKLPVALQTGSSGSPAACDISGLLLIDCNHLVGNIAMIQLAGSNNRVRDLKIQNTGAAAYQTIVWFTSAAASCKIELTDCPSGTAARVADNGTGSIVIDDDRALTATSSAGYSVLPGEKTIVFSAGSTVTLPSAASFPGRELHLSVTAASAVISGSSNVVPLAGGAAGTAILAATAGKWAHLVSNGTNWQIVAAN